MLSAGLAQCPLSGLSWMLGRSSWIKGQKLPVTAGFHCLPYDLTYHQCRVWFRVLSPGRSDSASEIKRMKHLLPAEVCLHE